MNHELKKYLSNICQLYGFACTIPFGQFWFNFIFKEKVSLESLVMSTIASIVGLLFLFAGGKISVDDRE